MIYPFKGFRYNKAAVRDISLVVTQPYDKISETLKKDYLERHPANVVRIIRNSDYLEAASLWHRWVQNKTLVQDQRPSLYIYRQNYRIGTEEIARTGFIGLVSLEDRDLEVKGHETILDKPVQDRLKVIRATEANEGLVFTLYSDKEQRTDRILEKITSLLEPEIDIMDDFDVRNRIWCLYDPRTINEITTVLKDRPLYIADGHHRFQTSILYNRECASRDWKPGAEESFDKRLIAAFNMESPGLRILATHRAVRKIPGAGIEGILKKAGRHFVFEPIGSLEKLEERMAEKSHSFGLAAGKDPVFYLMSLKEGALDDPGFMPGVKGKIRELDVTILHEGILGAFLGIDREAVTSGDRLKYFRNSADLAESLKRGVNQAGFLLRPTSLEKVKEVSESGEKMPQKSTDFFPKLLTGLVMMKMEIEK